MAGSLTSGVVPQFEIEARIQLFGQNRFEDEPSVGQWVACLLLVLEIEQRMSDLRLTQILRFLAVLRTAGGEKIEIDGCFTFDQVADDHQLGGELGWQSKIGPLVAGGGRRWDPLPILIDGAQRKIDKEGGRRSGRT